MYVYVELQILFMFNIYFDQSQEKNIVCCSIENIVFYIYGIINVCFR